MQGIPTKATSRGRNSAPGLQVRAPSLWATPGWLVPFSLFCNLVSVPSVAFCVAPSIPASGQVPWGFISCLGSGQAHPGVSIETADPGCEFLVLENPVWWKREKGVCCKGAVGAWPASQGSWAFALGERKEVVAPFRPEPEPALN